MSVLKPVKMVVLLCAAIVVLYSCQKEVSHSQPENPTGNAGLRNSGFVFDDAELVRHVRLLASADFVAPGNSDERIGKDRDKDGIPDSRDLCPTQRENYNGYQDDDGCPDTPPPTPPADSDADGIPDNVDACVNQPETYNGFEDQDGCPDTAPPPTDTTILPPPPAPLPASYFLNMPPVGHQGAEFSCIAWTVTYARSAEHYYATGATSYSPGVNIFSPEYIYNQAKASEFCSSGSGLYTSLNILKIQGVCTWQSMPYSDANGCSLLPSATQQAEAANYRIPTYSLVSQADQLAIKTLLSQNHPVMAGTSIDNNFTNAGPGFIWNSWNGSYGTNHGYVICGYDDARHAFKIINSWGTSWGDSGYSWIDYDFLGTLPGSLYVLY